jgi:hypothetical protein
MIDIIQATFIVLTIVIILYVAMGLLVRTFGNG